MLLDDYNSRISKVSSRGSDDIEEDGEMDDEEEEDGLSDGDIEDSDDELGALARGLASAAVPLARIGR